MTITFANAAEQYQKFPELKREEVLQLLEWMNNQPHLPKISELEAIIFLHSKYCQMDAAKKSIENYYTCRTKFTDFFENRNIQAEDIETIHNHMALVPLPQRTKEGYKIFMSRILISDHRDFVANSFYRLAMYVADAFLMEEGVAEGHVFIADAQGMNLGHLSKAGIFGMKRFVYYMQEILPFRVKGFHFINVNRVVEKFLMVIKPFMNKEFRQLIHAHTTIDSVYKFVEPEMLPSNYPGGKAPPIEELHETSFNHLLEFKDYFLEEEKTRRVDEKAREMKQKSFGKFLSLSR